MLSLIPFLNIDMNTCRFTATKGATLSGGSVRKALVSVCPEDNAYSMYSRAKMALAGKPIASADRGYTP